MTPIVLGAAATFVACWALVLTQDWHGRFTLDTSRGVQNLHDRPTPRIGGVAVMVGVMALWVQAQPDSLPIMGPALLASVPAFVFGLGEDLTKTVGPRARLLATLGSGALASALTGTALTHTGIPFLDAALQSWWPLAVAFTAIAVGGVANAVNIVDGFNGLAAGLVIICLCALGVVALQVGDGALAGLMFSLAAVAVGFLAVNFPMGKIFLGDGGAYLLGFWLAWLAVLLIERNPQVSPVAVLLACAYPVVEVIFSMTRRTGRAQSVVRPDRLHLHSLVQCRLARKRLAHWPAVMQNASVSPLVWLIASAPALMGAAFWDRPTPAWAGLLLFATAYVLIYRRLALFRWR